MHKLKQQHEAAAPELVGDREAKAEEGPMVGDVAPAQAEEQNGAGNKDTEEEDRTRELQRLQKIMADLKT